MFNFLVINKENIINALNILWKGMLAIFVTMTLIYVSILIINKFAKFIDE